MENPVRHFLDVCKADYDFRTFSSSAMSFLIDLAFTIYNGFLGIKYLSIWNGTICVYYILLAVVRGIIVNSQRKPDSRNREDKKKKIHFWTHIIMFMMNLSLIVPILAMINGDRAYNWGLIPAIAIATYTTYRIVMAIIHYSKSRKKDNILVKELRTANLIDTLVSVITLQNTMIIANEGELTGKMKILCIISSTAIWLLIMVLSILSFGVLQNKGKQQN